MIKNISLIVSVLFHAAVLTAFIILDPPGLKIQKQIVAFETFNIPLEQNYEAPQSEAEEDDISEQYISYSEKSSINPVPEQDTAYIDQEIIKSLSPTIAYIPKIKNKIKGGLLNGFGDGICKEQGSPPTGNILGKSISARNLGVILDTSPSMDPYRNKLEEDIKNGFKKYSIESIEGCELVTTASPTIKAIKNLVAKNVDAIYWFCDLQDKQTPKGLLAMSKSLERRNIKLYIKSLDKQPNFYLIRIVNRSGGEIL
jgi:hypothetical protein